MKKGILIGIVAGIVTLGLALGIVLSLFLARIGTRMTSDSEVSEEVSEETEVSEAQTSENAAETKGSAGETGALARTSFIHSENEIPVPSYTPQVAPYSTDAKLSNIENARRLYLQDAQIAKLAQNCFVVTDVAADEFFEIYESNRYQSFPNFVTTDSMMHTYHLYYLMLQKKMEKTALSAQIESMSRKLLAVSRAQYEDLKGTEWEDAALTNVAFFTVGAKLLDDSVQPDAAAAELVKAELDEVNAAQGIRNSLLTDDMEDYSQYKPRGYYEEDEQLQRYFRAMMWYGRRNFAQENEKLNRCALLMNLALQEDGLEEWKAVYTVTSFFAGASDDSGYFEYMPAILEAYGDTIGTKDLAGNTKDFDAYRKLTAAMEPPAINSVPFADDEGRTDKTERAKGYRLMGQRFSLDAAIFTQLMYSKVEKNPERNPDDQLRLLPDALDVPAALGSKEAYSILQEEGKTDYPNYDAQLSLVSLGIQSQPQLWSGSLYARWLNTLNPLLEEKGEGYPSFMTNREWTRKNLESYLGSWAELKHDSILYSKQAMAEMGGGDVAQVDDRGYVEPEPELFNRLQNMTLETAAGLKQFGMLEAKEEEELNRLAELAGRLSEISAKELNQEELDEDDYELIRSYGGSLEHFWSEAIRAKTGEEYNRTDENPAALIADVATDPNGSCLEVGISGADHIYVIVPVAGGLRVASGSVFSYYEFKQPLSERLTDSEWMKMIGKSFDMDTFWEEPQVDHLKPDWTKSYRQKYVYEWN